MASATMGIQMSRYLTADGWLSEAATIVHGAGVSVASPSEAQALMGGSSDGKKLHSVLVAYGNDVKNVPYAVDPQDLDKSPENEKSLEAEVPSLLVSDTPEPLDEGKSALICLPIYSLMLLQSLKTRLRLLSWMLFPPLLHWMFPGWLC